MGNKQKQIKCARSTHVVEMDFNVVENVNNTYS